MSFLAKIADALAVIVGPSWRTTLIAFVGAALADYAVQIDAIAVDPKYKPYAHLVALLIAAFGRACKDGSVVGTPEEARAERKAARAAKLSLVLGILILPTIAHADSPLVVCISGCPSKEMKLKATGDVQLSPTIWFGPSVGAFFVRDGATRSWEGSVQPALAYGIKYKPAWWTATASLLALDLFVSAKFSSTLTPQTIDLLPMLTVMNSLGVGMGPRIHLAAGPAERDAVSFLLAISVNTALGTP